MRKILTLIVIFLLSIGLIATLNGGEYVGLTGVLDSLSSIDFSFSDTTQVAIEMFDSFADISSGNIIDKITNATQGLFDLVRIPFVAIKEFLSLLSNIFDLLFTLVGVF